LLLTLGDKDNILSALLPFARKKRNDFWVWDVLSEAFAGDKEKVLSCLSRALSCHSPKEMLVGVRQKITEHFVGMELYNEAKTEIVQILEIKKANGHKIPNTISNWISSSWYQSAEAKINNNSFYSKHLKYSDDILFYDIPEELVFVEFVNKEKSILNFITKEFKTGFFKYDRFLREVKIGDIIKVRFQNGNDNARFNILTADRFFDEKFRNNFIKNFEGLVKLKDGNNFGFVNDVYIHFSLVEKYKLKDGMPFKGQAIMSYNKEKDSFGWKVL
jgi:hypothetical protein